MGDATAGGEELSGLYLVSISEREGKYNDMGSNWLGLEVSTYSFDQKGRNKRNL
jgi:hypothetical protein